LQGSQVMPKLFQSRYMLSDANIARPTSAEGVLFARPHEPFHFNQADMNEFWRINLARGEINQAYNGKSPQIRQYNPGVDNVPSQATKISSMVTQIHGFIAPKATIRFFVKTNSAKKNTPFFHPCFFIKGDKHVQTQKPRDAAGRCAAQHQRCHGAVC
jgi:hypothetical protein